MKFCVGCYLPLAMELSSKLLAANSHNEELSIGIQPGKTGSFEIFRDGTEAIDHPSFEMGCKVRHRNTSK